jgi:hypothetical protein
MTTNGLFLLLVFVTMTTKTNALIFPKRRLKIEKIKHRGGGGPLFRGKVHSRLSLRPAGVK